ncbi:MAG: Na+/H+ antiporter NhaC family protein, partial [Lentisphaeria bacterium]|nr:Na+/H+ antiporter NhaC family protein [Lentisphaeria bacterium]
MAEKTTVSPESSAMGHAAPCGAALIPFLIFVIFYLGLSLLAKDFYKVPMPVAFVVASAAALILNRKQSLMEKVEIFADGMGERNIMIMCLIFILAGSFAAVAKGMGAVDAAVALAQHLVPPNFMLAGIFLISCFISLAIGTSCGTIAALTPIAAGLVAPMGIAPEVMLSAVVGGAMFGDNLSMISDTTIAATRTQSVAMRDKFWINIRWVLPAALLTLIWYWHSGKEAALTAGVSLSATGGMVLAVIPYFLVLILALFGINVMALLFFGIVL